jgi:6-phosphofructokinase 2
MVRAKSAKFVLDSSGVALKTALGSGVHLIKPSLREFEQLAGKALPDEKAQLAAARKLIARRQCEQVALSLGEEGALLVGQDFSFRAKAPRVDVSSTVGAGDSFLGALVWAMAQNKKPQDALRFAVAAGSAAMLSRGTGLCNADDVMRLAGQVEVLEVETV